MAIRVFINGAQGKMGQEAVLAVEADPELVLVGKGFRDSHFQQLLQQTQPQVVVDLTTPDAVFTNAKTIIKFGAHPVIGTTGLTAEQIQQLQQLCAQQKLGAIIAPNFCISAILMMQFAAKAAQYMPDVEIIELHHNQKKDAPSGTAIKTAALIAEHRKQIPKDATEKEMLAGARGGQYQSIPIHSVRLPGLVASQEVIFGGNSETLTIRSDTIHRQAFMPGICLSCKKVIALDELVYGLENLL